MILYQDIRKNVNRRKPENLSKISIYKEFYSYDTCVIGLPQQQLPLQSLYLPESRKNLAYRGRRIIL